MISVLSAIFALSGWADSITLDLSTCIDLALKNNSDFKISGIELETAERAEKYSWNQFLPSLSASTSLSAGSTLFSSAGSGDTSWSFGASVSASLPINASLTYSIREIALAYESEEISYETARLNLVASVEQEFAYLVASAAGMDIEKGNLDLAKKRYEQTMTNFSHGLASELEVLQAKVTAANLEPTYLETVSDYKTQVREFLLVLGLDPETEVVLDGNLEPEIVEFDVNDLIAGRLEERQDIKELRLALETLRNGRSLTAADGLTPSLSLSLNWNTSVSDAFDSASWQSGSWEDGLSAGIGLSIPLDGYIPGSETSLSLKEIDDEIEAASINLAQAISEARLEILNLVEQLKTAAASMELSELNVELAKKSYEMSEESFSRGTVQRLDVEDAQQEYSSAKQQYLLSQYTYISGLIDLRVALGLDDWKNL